MYPKKISAVLKNFENVAKIAYPKNVQVESFIKQLSEKTLHFPILFS
jgi:hypothetical protein